MSLDLSSTVTRLTRKLAAASESGFISLVKTSDSVFDETTGELISEGEEVKTGLNGAVSSYSDSLVDGTRIVQGDRRVTVDNQVEIKNNDLIEINGELCSVVNLEEKNHAGIVQAYTFTARFL